MCSLRLLTLILARVAISFGDISHLFTPEYAIFPQHPFQFAIHQPLPISIPQQQQPTLPALYGPPQPPALAGYPDPLPTVRPTHSPVAPTQTTTEFFLPEIIENRSAKDKVNFIPLQSQYLPPDERPNYESPKPPNSSGSHPSHHHGYYYPHPSTTTTTTTTERPSPIVVIEPEEPSPPFQGYDYNAPPPPPSKPPSTPAPVYLPPPAIVASGGLNSEEAAVVEQFDASSPLRVRVKEMRCLQQFPNGYFRSALKVDSFIPAAPSVDNDSNDKRCELRLSRSYVIVDITAENFSKCGIHSCGKDLCLRVRFPAIRGMRTHGDAILTLHCKSQERVATKTHALKMGVANDVQARSVGTYAHGGTQNPLRTHVELLRRSKNGYTRHLESNGAVQLGEDLLLRAHVLPGDGWNYTKLSDVNLQRISPTGELLNTAQLVTGNGCLNPSMQNICKQPPTYDAPLGYKLNFKAVMFEGMHSGDEIVMSMRITACLESEDCYVNQQQCSSGQYANNGRRRRDTDIGIVNPKKQTEISEISRISFRVIMDDIEVNPKQESNASEVPMVSLRPRVLVLASSLGFVALMTCLGVIAAWKLNR